MNKLSRISELRKNLQNGEVSLGTWQQIPHPAISEIIASQGYEWVVVDLEHGSIDVSQLPYLFCAIESKNALPFVRVRESNYINAHSALEAGATGLIFPMIENSEQLSQLIEKSKLPPSGSRGVGFSRSCLYGKNFEENLNFAQTPFIVAMIESQEGLKNIDSILETKNLDAILIGPYDLSASLGKTGDFEADEFLSAIKKIEKACKEKSIPKGIHVVKPSKLEVEKYIEKEYQFIVYSTDALFLLKSSELPK